mgnify:CR=1 FL=1
MAEYLIGIDLGTTSCRSIIHTAKGKPIASAYREYNVLVPKPGWAEQDPNEWWEATKWTLRQSLERSGVSAEDIAAIGLTGQQPSTVFVDRKGNTLCPSILWMDRRTSSQCEFMKSVVGEERLYEITGLRADPAYSASKILWTRENMPEVYEKTYKVLLPKDYLAYKLTGSICLDLASACATQLVDIHKRQWSSELVNNLRIREEILPDICLPTTVLGDVEPEVARDVGLATKVAVVSGAGDTTVSALGSGAVAPARTCVNIGTSSDVMTSVEKPVLDKKMRVGYYIHAVPGRFLSIMGANTSGASLRWFRDCFYHMEKESEQSLGLAAYKLMDSEAENISPGSEGLIFLPYLLGERSPIFDPLARGTFFGITMRHNRAHFVRSVLEGVAYSIRDRLEVLRELGMDPAELILTGGGARSALWLNIIANVTGKPVTTLVSEESTCIGAIMLAGVGVGVYREMEKAADEILTPSSRIKPQIKIQNVYDRFFPIYRKLYESTKDLFTEVP